MSFVAIYAALISYAAMVAAYFLHRHRWLHVPIMAGCLLFDVSMPIYLYTHRNWYHRLIEQGDLFSFLVWMHFGLLVGMYVLYGMQIWTARRMLAGHPDARADHHSQGKMMLLARGLVIVTGAILASPG
jgi:hypothetical protein